MNDRPEPIRTRIYHLLRDYALPIGFGAFIGGCGPDIDHLFEGQARTWGHSAELFIVLYFVGCIVVIAHYRRHDRDGVLK